ncbi:serine--tRNA ligase [Candidatus Gracilibacteria bacterium]|jgi:seryl-tRNA synthetase|nr:serine--tRNA ligase [Candidatus Gracilibacteria bacterium]
MLDINFIRENLELVVTGLKRKYSSIDRSFLEKALELDEKRRSLITKLDDVRSQKNQASKEIATLSGDERNQKIAAMKQVGEEETKLTEELNSIEPELTNMLLRIPNLPAQDVPDGTEADNQPFKTVGTIPKFDFPPRDHVELGELLDIIDIEAAQKASGARFYYLKNEAVLLEFALIQFATQKLLKHNFVPVITPVLVKEEAMYATGFFPADGNEVYHVNPGEDDLYLVGTSEVPLTMLHADQILDINKLPLRYFGFSSCFRREAGSYGKDTKGILRVHQFDKLEMFSFCGPDQSATEHELIRSIEEEIFADLGIPYQVINICAGDLGAPAVKKYDIEAYIPTQEKYREVTSCSNYHEFTARRAKIRFRDQEGKTQFVHTLNGTAIAIGRALIAIIENNQQADGSVIIPEPLRAYLNGQEVIKPRK